MKFGLLFPGQGAQFLGMGQRWYERSQAVRELYETAEARSGLPIRAVSFTRPRQEQANTDVTQPCVFIASLACLLGFREELARRGVADGVVAVAGHSLGHFSALVAAGALDLIPALELVQRRGQIMYEAGLRRPGGMATVVGLPVERVMALLSDEGRVDLCVAAVNGPDQVVVSGSPAGLGRLAPRAMQAGAERVVPLAIGIAAHTPFMRDAEECFRTEVESLSLATPRVPIALNTTAQLTTDPAAVRSDLMRHMTRPVLWWEAIGQIRLAGVRCLVDVGPGRTLSRVLQRHLPRQEVVAIDHPGGVDELLR